MKETVLVFDFDQTLGHRDGMWSISILELLQEAGFTSFSIEEVRRHSVDLYPWDLYEYSHEELFGGRSFWDYVCGNFARVLQALGLDVTDAACIASRLPERYLDIRRWRLYPDTLPVLEELNAQGYRCAIVSNHVPELDQLVTALGLSPVVEQVFNSSLIGWDKPNGNIFRFAQKALEVPESQLVMIGDNFVSDITGARSCGWKAILVRGENPFAYRWHAADLFAVPSILAKLLGGLS